jgi:hypothetical protein
MYNYEKAKEILGDRVIVIAIEEMAELSQQLTKGLCGKMNKEHLLEEYADCLIIMEWIKRYYDLSDEEINKWLDKKMNEIGKK